MDERETLQENRLEKGRKKGTVFIFLLALALIVGIGLFMIGKILPPKGCEDYTLQMEQYYVEYSEQYDYWDVITVEYPHLSGGKEEVQEQINGLLYDVAMDRVNYWHLSPSQEVEEFQKENFSIFASDVSCEIPYHSQYLVSAHFMEAYCAGNPIWMTNLTERGMTVDLLTGQVYGLLDIFDVNSDFIRLWDGFYSKEAGEEVADEETIALLLSWFLEEDPEILEDFQCRPGFYLTEEGDFVVGLSINPVLEEAVTYEPAYWGYFTRIDAQTLEPFRKESEFWKKYDRSESAGEVLPCSEKHGNIWLGEEASVWNWEY